MFRIVKYLMYEKPGEYGDPKADEFTFLVEDNMQHPKVPGTIRDALKSLNPGDMVLLSWNHDYVTINGNSSPERPITRLEKIAPAGTRAWLYQIDRLVSVSDQAGHGLTIGSDHWMQAVSVELGVFDEQGHGPTPGSEEWRNALQRRAFGFNSPAGKDTGEQN